MRAEVASLTRNILVQGIMANANDSHGGNTRFLKGFKNVHIDGVEYTNVGQVSIFLPNKKKKEKNPNTFHSITKLATIQFTGTWQGIWIRLEDTLNPPTSRTAPSTTALPVASQSMARMVSMCTTM